MAKSWFIVSDPRQIRVLASPGREEILDAVIQIGRCSISELARALGRSRHALYYPVRALRDCGLLIERFEKRRGAKPTAIYDAPGRPMAVSFDLSTKARRAAVRQLGIARLKRAAREFEASVESGEAQTEGADRELWATQVKGSLSDAELHEANRLLTRLVELLSKPPTPERKGYMLTFAMTPASAPNGGLSPLANP
jgi:DNA-binding transcriptional ArsR family regulator